MTIRGLAGFSVAFLLLVSGLAAGATDVPLVLAAKQGNIGLVRSLLNQHVDVNAAEPDGTTALAWAAERGDVEMVDLFLRAEARVNTANEYGATPLWIASATANAAVVEKLLNAGATPNAPLLSGETPLMTATEAGSLDVVKLLVSHRVNVNAKENQAGQTALMWATAERHPEITKVLLEHGADVNASAQSGFTALMFAAQEGDVMSAEMLLAAGADVNHALKDGTTPLLRASATGQEPVLLLLLSKGADPNVADVNGYTALHYAAARRNRVESVKALLAQGAKPNARLLKDPAKGDSNSTTIGATPFFLAAEARNVANMRLLASNGADPFLSTSATMFSNEQNGYRLQVVANTTPLAAAAGSGRFNGNYIEFTESEERNAIEAVKLAMELGGDINEGNEYGQTALHAAAYLKADRLVEFLVQNGARMDLIDKFGQTPLSIAGRVITEGVKDSYDLSPRRHNASTYQLLLKLGATPLASSGIKIFQVPPELK